METTPLPVKISDVELRLLRSLVYEECGMHFDEGRLHFLQDRLRRRLRACSMDSFYSYYRLLTSNEGRGELSALLENLTVNETSFFRNRPQLELFGKSILGSILRRKQAHRDWTLKIWSAGCSTGQEPYTIAMQVCDALSYYHLRNSIEAPLPKPLVPEPWKVEILASDISYSALRTAQQGVYTDEQMQPVDYSYRLRYFDRTGSNYTVRPGLRQLVHFDFHNLKTGFVPQRNDIIFCRNVMIYFDAAEQKRLVDKFYRGLNPEGYVFVGHAETLLGFSDKFRMIHENQGTAYQRVEPAQ